MLVIGSLWVLFATQTSQSYISACGKATDPGSDLFGLLYWPFIMVSAWISFVILLIFVAGGSVAVYRKSRIGAAVVVMLFPLALLGLTVLYWWVIGDGLDPGHFRANVINFCGGEHPWWSKWWWPFDSYIDSEVISMK